ncbi:MAG: thioredoxin family protein [Planctomycetaceae bacterium]|jgi:thioredoxin-related protein|nr:thioredoxin family protein [Planctomycetaceae bacterium]
MFKKFRLFFIFAAIFFVSFILLFIFSPRKIRFANRDSDVFISEVGKPEVVEFSRDFGAALEGARGERKPLIVFFTLMDNENCKRAFELFKNQEIQRLAKHFVCVAVDGGASRLVCESYRVSAFPTVLILDNEGKEIQRLTGKETKEQLTIQMHIAIQLSTNADKNKIR